MGGYGRPQGSTPDTSNGGANVIRSVTNPSPGGQVTSTTSTTTTNPTSSPGISASTSISSSGGTTTYYQQPAVDEKVKASSTDTTGFLDKKVFGSLTVLNNKLQLIGELGRPSKDGKYYGQENGVKGFYYSKGRPGGDSTAVQVNIGDRFWGNDAKLAYITDKLRVVDNVEIKGANISAGEIITLEIEDQGKNYVIGDVLGITGGSATLEVIDVSEEPPSYARVGEILTYSVLSTKGTFINGSVIPVYGGKGQNATATLTVVPPGSPINSVKAYHIEDGGIGYKIDDIVTISGGYEVKVVDVVATNTYDLSLPGAIQFAFTLTSGTGYSVGNNIPLIGGSGTLATVNILAVDKTGKIISWEIENPGKDYDLATFAEYKAYLLSKTFTGGDILTISGGTATIGVYQSSIIITKPPTTPTLNKGKILRVVDHVNTGTYTTGIKTSTGGSGTGATFHVTAVGQPSSVNVIKSFDITNGGCNYKVGDKLTVLGGNCVMRVTAIKDMWSTDLTDVLTKNRLGTVTLNTATGYTTGTNVVLTGGNGVNGEISITGVDGSGNITTYNLTGRGYGYQVGDELIISGGLATLTVDTVFDSYLGTPDPTKPVYSGTPPVYVPEVLNRLVIPTPVLYTGIIDTVVIESIGDISYSVQNNLPLMNGSGTGALLRVTETEVKQPYNVVPTISLYGGENYAVRDIVTIGNTSNCITLKVLSVTTPNTVALIPKGKILQVDLKTNGSGYSVANNVILTGGSGTTATCNILSVDTGIDRKTLPILKFTASDTTASTAFKLSKDQEPKDIVYTLPEDLPEDDDYVLTADKTTGTMSWIEMVGGSPHVYKKDVNTNVNRNDINTWFDASTSPINRIDPATLVWQSNTGYTTISGGLNNQANRTLFDFIGGGVCNKIGYDAFVDPVPGDFPTGCVIVGGGYNYIIGHAISHNGASFATICGGSTNKIKISDSSFIGGGYNNEICAATGSTIVGGTANVISPVMGSSYCFIGAGSTNTITDKSYSVIGGGQLNTSKGGHAFLGGGYSNSIGGAAGDVICGGSNNSTVSTYSGVGCNSILGGKLNVMSSTGDYNTILAGYGNTITGNGGNNTVFGTNATTAFANTLVWSDSTAGGSDRDQQAVFYAHGGFKIHTGAGDFEFVGNPGTAGAQHDKWFVTPEADCYLDNTGVWYVKNLGAVSASNITANLSIGAGLSIDGNGDLIADGGWLTTVDISTDTNLATSAPIVLTGDTLSIEGSRTSDSLLTTTGSTSIATHTPSVQGNFVAYIYYRVITSTTDVTVTVTYTDGTGAQTNTVLSAQSSPVGSYSCIPVFINATTSAISVNATAGTANQVYVSASIVGI